MHLSPWDPWRALQQLRIETDRLWDEFLDKLSHAEAEPTQIAFLPDVDVVETPHEYRLYLSVPGLVEEDIDIAIGERSLTVRGERQPPYDATHAHSRLREWRYGFFERRIELSHPISAHALRALCDAGVLTIVVEKIAE